MLELDGLFAIATLVLWAYCIFDVIRTPDGTTENLPKMIWLLIVIFIPTIGSIAWLLLGRPRRQSFDLRSHASYRAPDPLPPTGLPAPPPRDDDYQRKREDALRRYPADR